MSGEQFAAEIGAVQGIVKLRAHSLQDIRTARRADKMFGGGVLQTGADGEAILVARRVGGLVVSPSTRLTVPLYTSSGSILVRGSLLLDGVHVKKSQRPAYLHCPPVAIRAAEGAKAAVAVGENGRTRIAVLLGSVQALDTLGHPRTISRGEAILYRLDSEAGKLEKMEPRNFSPNQLSKWLTGQTLRPTERPSTAAAMLSRAEKTANRLELDVERLAELMQLNRQSAAERKNLNPKDDGAAKKLVLLNARFAEQAREMVDLRLKGELQISSIVAHTERARLLTPDNTGINRRIASLDRRLETMSKQLPPLFDRPKDSTKKTQRLINPGRAGRALPE